MAGLSRGLYKTLLYWGVIYHARTAFIHIWQLRYTDNLILLSTVAFFQLLLTIDVFYI